jgi:hypothetical protein
MKYCVLFILNLFLLFPHLRAQEAAVNHNEVESTWQGVLMQLIMLKRTSEDRVLVLVRLQATQKAAPSTLIGTRVPIPPGTTKQEIQSGAFVPQPFSFASAIMTDELTKQVFPVVPPNPKALAVAPSAIMTNLTRGEAFVISVEFKVPPPPVDSTGHQAKQIVSISLPNAKAAFTNLYIPPPVAVAAPR